MCSDYYLKMVQLRQPQTCFSVSLFNAVGLLSTVCSHIGLGHVLVSEKLV